MLPLILVGSQFWRRAHGVGVCGHGTGLQEGSGGGGGGGEDEGGRRREEEEYMVKS